MNKHITVTNQNIIHKNVTLDVYKMDYLLNLEFRANSLKKNNSNTDTDTDTDNNRKDVLLNHF